MNLISLILQQQGACRHLEGLQPVTALLLVLPAMAVRKDLVQCLGLSASVLSLSFLCTMSST